jgi:hypothetical protein
MNSAVRADGAVLDTSGRFAINGDLYSLIHAILWILCESA